MRKAFLILLAAALLPAERHDHVEGASLDIEFSELSISITTRESDESIAIAERRYRLLTGPAASLSGIEDVKLEAGPAGFLRSISSFIGNRLSEIVSRCGRYSVVTWDIYPFGELDEIHVFDGRAYRHVSVTLEPPAVVCGERDRIPMVIMSEQEYEEYLALASSLMTFGHREVIAHKQKRLKASSGKEKHGKKPQ